jgi:hypothetical protein
MEQGYLDQRRRLVKPSAAPSAHALATRAAAGFAGGCAFGARRASGFAIFDIGGSAPDTPGCAPEPRITGGRPYSWRARPPIAWPTRTRTPSFKVGDSAARPGSRSTITVEPISKAPSSWPFATGMGTR